MCKELKTPCAECPWRKDSMKGWLGNSTSVEFLQLSESEARMPCHMHVDYEKDNWRDQAASAPQCAGRAIHFANRGKLAQNPELIKMKPDFEKVFSNPQDFINHHHIDTQSEPPRIMLLGQMVMVIS